MSRWTFGRRPRNGERRMPNSFAELDAYVESQIDWWLVREDLVVCSRGAIHQIAEMAGCEVTDDTNRRQVIVRRKDVA